jgi:hypothetical protein
MNVLQWLKEIATGIRTRVLLVQKSWLQKESCGQLSEAQYHSLSHTVIGHDRTVVIGFL